MNPWTPPPPEVDTAEWRRSIKSGLRANRRFYGVLTLCLTLIPLLYLVVLHYRIEASLPQGLPSGYRLVAFHEVYRDLKPEVLEWREDAYLTQAYFEIYPNWGYPREPDARLVFYSPEDEYELYVSVREVDGEYEVYMRDHLLQPEFSRDTFLLPVNSPTTFTDPVLEALDNLGALEGILKNGGNDFILRHEYIAWPASLYLKNLSQDAQSFDPTWELCFRLNFFTPDFPRCYTLPSD